MAYPQESYRYVTLTSGSLISQRRHVASENTLLYQLDVLKKTGRYDAFKLGWHPSYSDPPVVWPVPNHLFWDSDVAKWIEGACYLLHNQPHSQIKNAIQELVEMIASAQQPDGYLNIHFTVVEPGKRFINLRDFHELYNAGHLIEAALAHNLLYGNDDFLGPILKYVDLLCCTFGSGENQIHGYPGHPEIELALLRLHKRTHNPAHLALAQYFLRERGNPTGDNGEHFFMAEAQRRGDDPHQMPAYWPASPCLWYYSAHEPIVSQRSVEGHSVRMMYLLTAAADLCVQTAQPDPEMRSAISRLWTNMVSRKMYVTGGIGAIKQWEGFGLDYFLPQSTDEGGCYNETCAAIGVMMLAERMLQYDLNGAYADVMELCLFNAVLTAMSNDGRQFTYTNQLASSDGNLVRRHEWFSCACCPPNMLRLLGQIAGYICTVVPPSKSGSVQLNVHLYVASSIRFETSEGTGILTLETDWPRDGKVRLLLSSPAKELTVRLRIPAWAGSSWTISPPLAERQLDSGYLTLAASWLTQHPNFELHVPFEPRVLSSHPQARPSTLSIARGPLIYCVEDYDNPWEHNHFRDVQLDPRCMIKEQSRIDTKTGEVYVALTVMKGASQMRMNGGGSSGGSSSGSSSNGSGSNNNHHNNDNDNDNDTLFPTITARELQCLVRDSEIIDELHFIPYYFVASRGGRGQARVGLKHWHRS